MILYRYVGMFLATLCLSSCGYHLAGQGDGQGMIPTNVETVSIQASGDQSLLLVNELRRQMALNASRSYLLLEQGQQVANEELHAILRMMNITQQYVPSAFDVSGIATQYRLTIQSSLQLYFQGDVIWDSGAIAVSGDVYVVDDPTGAEASRERLGKDLRKQWAQRVLGRLQSGF